MEDGFEEFSDDDTLSLAPVKIKLLFSEFVPRFSRSQQMISASGENDSVLLEELLPAPQDPNVVDECGNTPLHHAAPGMSNLAVRQVLRSHRTVE